MDIGKLILIVFFVWFMFISVRGCTEELDAVEELNPFEEGGTACLVTTGERVIVLDTRMGSTEDPKTAIRWPNNGVRVVVHNYELKACDDGSE